MSGTGEPLGCLRTPTRASGLGNAGAGWASRMPRDPRSPGRALYLHHSVDIEGIQADLVAGLEAGADDYLTKPSHSEELTARLRTGQRIIDLQDGLIHDARHDSLTLLPNRTGFLYRLTQCVDHSKRDQNYRFAVRFVDLDRFKAVNDILGHPAGDELLIQVAETTHIDLRKRHHSSGIRYQAVRPRAARRHSGPDWR
jgi:hypothetical protein